jgi:hypothetical protein
METDMTIASSFMDKDKPASISIWWIYAANDDCFYVHVYVV